MTHPKSTRSSVTAPKFCRSVNAGSWKAAITLTVRVTGIRYMNCGEVMQQQQGIKQHIKAAFIVSSLDSK